MIKIKLSDVTKAMLNKPFSSKRAHPPEHEFDFGDDNTFGLEVINRSNRRCGKYCGLINGLPTVAVYAGWTYSFEPECESFSSVSEMKEEWRLD